MKNWDWKRWPWTTGLFGGSLLSDKFTLRQGSYYRHDLFAKFATLIANYPEVSLGFKFADDSFSDSPIVISLTAPAEMYEEVWNDIESMIRECRKY